MLGYKKWGTLVFAGSDLVEEDVVDFLFLFLRARFFCFQGKKM
jgi:hypothetical protein